MDAKDDEYEPRAEDALIEPFLAGLAGKRRVSDRGRGPAGCGPAAVLLAALLGLLQACA